jgi:hypothetical protein
MPHICLQNVILKHSIYFNFRPKGIMASNRIGSAYLIFENTRLWLI